MKQRSKEEAPGKLIKTENPSAAILTIQQSSVELRLCVRAVCCAIKVNEGIA
jgi:hypothetical protein